MPRTYTIKKTVFAFSELSDKAKEKARDWYRSGALHYDWFNSIYDDFETICKILGITLRYRAGRNMKGEPTRGAPCIYFTGFCSQGDGACFEGSYSYTRGALKNIKSHAPDDETLARIASDLQDVQRKAFYWLSADIKHRGHYYHANCMAIEVANGRTRYGSAAPEQEDAIKDAIRSLANWLYRQLEKEHDYLMSDESVDESICANGYEFTENGSFAS